MNLLSAIFVVFLAVTAAKDCPNKKSHSKLFCYYSKVTDIDNCQCSHIILPTNSDVKSINRLRETVKGVKILITVNEFNEGLVNTIKNSKIDGLEINLHKLDSKNDISDFISTVRSKLGSDLYIALSVPAKGELLSKYYDFKSLSKSADSFILQTAFLGANKNVTFHPSRLSGLWDMQNTDSVVDLVSGMGAPLSKLVITAPVQAFHFKLQNEKHTAPGSPALEIKSITRPELCSLMNSGNWTLERDQDQAGPYIFSKDQWIAFDDATSMDIKAKYSRIRGLAGMALKDLSQDGGEKCGGTLLEAAYNGLSRQARAPRQAILKSLEREIIETPTRALDHVQVSPYRISRVIDTEGKIHVIRQDTRTEFACSRQGYFVHPRSCNRFYRCVKFDQLSDEFSVFEFDCPAGLAFDERVEVCVWPGSLPDASACSGSSEIAPVPRERFVCPSEPGYYADPENCRWFFACLDHGKSPLSAYEFRCPFGLVFDQSRLLCEWPWIVPKCANGAGLGINLASGFVYGGAGSASNALDHYDGLGGLGAVSLGGLQGPLQQPVAKIYSNVASSYNNGLGLNAGLNLGQSNVHGGGSYVHYNGLNNGLSVKAVKSLESAGLLSTGYGNNNAINVVNIQDSGSNIGYTGGNVLEVQNIPLGSDGFQDVSSIAVGNSGLEVNSGNYGAKTQSTSQYHGLSGIVTDGFESVGNVGGLEVNSGNYGAKTQSTSQYHGLSGIATDSFESVGNVGGLEVNSGNYGAKTQSTSQYHGLSGIASDSFESVGNVGGLEVNSGNYGAKTQSTSQYHGVSGIATGTYNTGSVGNVKVLNAGAASSQYDSGDTSRQTINQVHNQGSTVLDQVEGTQGFSSVEVQDNGAEYESGVSGNVNIVGGGYSAVGVANNGVEISHDGANLDLVSVTPAPAITYSTVSSIPVVTAVPVPSVKTTVQTEGGVIANVPELQYKLSTPAPSNVFLQNTYSTSLGQVGNTKATSSFINYGSKTPQSATVSVGYEYNKPSVSYVQKPIVQEQIKIQQPVLKVQQPVVTVQEQKTFVQPAVSSYSFQKQDNGGYHYDKPLTAFEEQPIDYEQNPVIVSTPAPFVAQTVVKQSVVQQPAVSVSVKNQPSFDGYHYQKPSLGFEEKPIVQQPAVVASYNYQNPVAIQKPSVQQPIIEQKLSFVPSYSYQKTVDIQKSIGPVVQKVVQPTITSYAYEKPATYQQYFNYQPNIQKSVDCENEQLVPLVQQKPAVFSTYNYQQPTQKINVQPVVNQYTYQNIAQKSVGYSYPTPEIAFEERPVVSTYNYVAPSTVRPLVIHKQPTVIQQNYVKPAVVSSYNYVSPSTVKPAVVQKQNVFQGYSYEKPAVAFEEKQTVNVQQPALVESYNYVAPSTVNSEIIQQNYAKPAVVSSYNYVSSSTVKPAVVQNQNVFQGYSYEKPAVAFEEKQTVNVQQPALVESYNYVAPSTVNSEIIQQNYAKPAVVSSYNYVSPSTVKPAVVQNQNVFQGYNYEKPAVAFEEKPVVHVQQPAVVSSYNYVAPSTIKPAVVLQKQPEIVQQTYVAPAVVSNYNYVAPSTVKPAVVVQKQNVFEGYYYEKPSRVFEEKPVVKVQQLTYNYSYVAPTTVKPAVFIQKQPELVLSYTTPVPLQPVVSVKKQPAVVSSYNYVAPTQPIHVQQQNTVEFKGYDYPKPTVGFVEQPRPFDTNYDDQQPVKEAPFVAKNAYVTGNTYQYKQPAVKPVVVENYVSTTPVYKQVDLDSSKFYYKNNVDNVYYSTARPVEPVVYQQTPEVKTYINFQTSKPTFKSTVASIVANNVQNQYYYDDSRLNVTPKTVVKTYKTVLPTLQTVTTSRPIVKYSFGGSYEYTAPQNPTITSQTKEYLPPVNTYIPSRKVAVTTSPSREYLPSEEIEVTSRRPVKVVKVVRPRPKAIVKVNDYHPQLTSKLGAQCTCSSPTLRLRKKTPTKKIKVEIEDADSKEDDEYIVKTKTTKIERELDENSELEVGFEKSGPIIVENYEAERVIDITPTPEVIIKSTSPSYEPSSTAVYQVRKRLRSRPVTSTEKVEVSIKKKTSVIIDEDDENDDNESSDREIVKAVRTGLKLVKQAAKAGAKEGTKEVLRGEDVETVVASGRSRLSAEIDCQRPGLFRHPTQCNKFYACRWDCNKNRYTLHVFNCPVHLTFDNSLGACNWPSQGPTCLENTLLPSD